MVSYRSCSICFVGSKKLYTVWSAPLMFIHFSFPRPSNGGQDCPGVNYEYQLCNTDDCPKHFEDFRAQQCQLRNSHFEFQSAKHHWLPYEHPDGKPAKCQQIVFCSSVRPEEQWKMMRALDLDSHSQTEEKYCIFKTGMFSFRHFQHTDYTHLCKGNILKCILSCFVFLFLDSLPLPSLILFNFLIFHHCTNMFKTIQTWNVPFLKRSTVQIQNLIPKIFSVFFIRYCFCPASLH